MKKWSLITHAGFVIIMVVFFLANILGGPDLRLQDIFYQTESRTDPDIVMITIDDESLAEIGRWPWDRYHHADLVEILAEGDPAVIAFDIILSEPSSNSEHDRAMLDAFGRVDNIITPVYGRFAAESGRGSLEALALTRPFPELEAITTQAHINTIPDYDGLVRRTLLQFQYNGEFVDSLALTIYNLYADRHGLAHLSLNDIPTDAWQQMYIKYSGEPYSFEQIPYARVLAGDIPAEYFRDKIVFVGSYAVGIDDYYFTPMAPETPMFGMEIHANIVQQLMRGDYAIELSLWAQILIMLVFAIIGWIIYYRVGPGIGLVAMVGLIVGYFALALGLDSMGWMVAILYVPVLVIGQYVISLGHQFLAEQLEKKRVTDVFGKYVAPQIVGKILDEGEAGLQLGGIKRDVSVLFVDIRGFTPLSEAAEPEEVVAILNEYLTLCAQSIFDNGGTLDKFIGDATMALFNAPFDLEDHQMQAVKTALDMARGAEPLQEELEKRFGKTVRFGIGIHTGPAIIGNIGAKFRMDYTAIGDTVNTAARIESNTKPGQILISADVYEHVQGRIIATDMGLLQMKGKSQGIQVYQVEGLA